MGTTRPTDRSLPQLRFPWPRMKRDALRPALSFPNVEKHRDLRPRPIPVPWRQKDPPSTALHCPRSGTPRELPWLLFLCSAVHRRLCLFFVCLGPANPPPRPSQVPWRSGTHDARCLPLGERGPARGTACPSIFLWEAQGPATPSLSLSDLDRDQVHHSPSKRSTRGCPPRDRPPVPFVCPGWHGGTGQSMVFPFTCPGPHWQPASTAIPVSRDTQDLAARRSSHYAPGGATDAGT